MSQRVVTFLVIALIFVLVVGCGERQTKEQLFAMAEKFELEENFQSAIKAYKKILKKHGDTKRADHAQYKMALIYSNNLHDFDKSIATYLDLMEKYPESKYAAQALFMIGYDYANNIQDLDKAREYYQKFIDSYPEHELVTSVKWELDHLGQDINEIQFIDPAEGAATTQ